MIKGIARGLRACIEEIETNQCGLLIQKIFAKVISRYLNCYSYSFIYLQLNHQCLNEFIDLSNPWHKIYSNAFREPD